MLSIPIYLWRGNVCYLLKQVCLQFSELIFLSSFINNPDFKRQDYIPEVHCFMQVYISGWPALAFTKININICTYKLHTFVTKCPWPIAKADTGNQCWSFSDHVILKLANWPHTILFVCVLLQAYHTLLHPVQLRYDCSCGWTTKAWRRALHIARNTWQNLKLLARLVFRFKSLSFHYFSRIDC